ncbi:MAG: phosphorylcholine transferase LicD [Crocinitomicaceae bacterium]
MEEDFSVYNGEKTNLRRAQLRMLDILSQVSLICDKHSIPYWIDYGTLLGAVRHGGFIPWDDDLDISVLKKDYKKLLNALQNELPKNFVFQDWKNEKKLTLKAAKVRDTNSYYDDGLTQRGEMNYQGIFIDIFPVDFIPSIQIKKFIDFFYGRSFRRLRGLNSSKIEYFVAWVIWPFALFLAFLFRLLSSWVRSSIIANIHGGLNLPAYHDKSDVFPLQKINFEGKEFSCPNNCDKFLRSIYGDYMKIPPKEKRQVHANSIEFLD